MQIKSEDNFLLKAGNHMEQILQVLCISIITLWQI